MDSYRLFTFRSIRKIVFLLLELLRCCGFDVRSVMCSWVINLLSKCELENDILSAAGLRLQASRFLIVSVLGIVILLSLVRVCARRCVGKWDSAFRSLVDRLLAIIVTVCD